MAEIPERYVYTVELRIDPVNSAQNAGLSSVAELAAVVDSAVRAALVDLSPVVVEQVRVLREERA